MFASKKPGSIVFTIYNRLDCTQAHIEQVLAVDGLLGLVVREVVSSAAVLEGQQVHTGGAELDEVRDVHLLDVAVEDVLQAAVSERPQSQVVRWLLTFLRPLSSCCMNLTVHSFSGGR